MDPTVPGPARWPPDSTGNAMIGTSVDRYEILEELGHGGMSVVYRGFDSALERDVAVKVLHNHLAKKAENRKRFHREAKAIARLRHPNILEVYDFSGEDEERSYIVMEYVAGENLRQFATRTGSPPPELVALLGVQICDALEHAHDHGIIHRDLKPENVMVSCGGELKLMDFGIAHVIDAETMTATGSLMGSPAHMAPELIDGQRVDVRADIFSLGTVLYWLATGRLPFEGANAPQVLKRVLEGDFDEPDTIEPRVGRRLGAIISRCLARDPDARYADVVAVRRALQDFAASTGYAGAEELKRYLRDPLAYREEFDDQIVERLLALARRAERDRDVPLAVALFNRILAYDPQNGDVQRTLDRLCRAERLRAMTPVAIGGVLVALVVTSALVFGLTRPPNAPQTAPPPDPSPVARDTASSIVDSAALAVEARAEPVADAVVAAREVVSIASLSSAVVAENAASVAVSPRPIVVPVQRTLAPPPAADAGTPAEAPPAMPTYRWRFSVTPPAATFKIDQQIVDPLLASSGIELTEGVHDLWAQGRGTLPWSGRIRVDADGSMPIVLEWAPGQVEVESNVDVVVWFDGAVDPTRVGRRGAFEVPFGPANSTESSRVVTLRVAHVGDLASSQTRRVTVRAGDIETAYFNFSPEL